MGRKNKLQRFADNLSFPNVYENFDVAHTVLTGKDGTTADMKGKWNELHFKNDNPLVLELACGYGEYCVGMGKMYPNRNFLGVDIKGARIWSGAKLALKEGIENAAFLRTRIEMIDKFFAPEEVSEIWITFPDPFLRESKSNRRLTSPPFLARRTLRHIADHRSLDDASQGDKWLRRCVLLGTRVLWHLEELW